MAMTMRARLRRELGYTNATIAECLTVIGIERTQRLDDDPPTAEEALAKWWLRKARAQQRTILQQLYAMGELELAKDAA